MRIRKCKNGVITMTATSKRDSLNLLKFLNAMAGDNDPDRQKMIEERENLLKKVNEKL